MAETLLIGIDGSKCCDRAVARASKHAKDTGAHLLVAFVIEWSRFTFNTPEENEKRHQRREEEIKVANERVLEPMVSALKAEGVDAQGIVRHGHAAEVLAGLAHEHKVAQIYVGRTGQTKLEALVFGSVAAKLVQLSPVPVTVVP